MFYSGLKQILILISLFCLLIPVYSQNNNIADSLLNKLNKTKVDTDKVNILNELSWLYNKSDFQKAYTFADSALKLSQKISFNSGIALSYTHKAYAQIRLGKPDDALININKSLAVYEILKDKVNIAKNLTTISQIYYGKQDYDKAVEYTEKSIEIRKQNNILKDTEINYMILGVIYTEQGKYTEALEMLFISVDNCEKNSNKNSLASNYNNIAIVYRKLNDSESAIEYYNKALDIYKNLNNIYGELKILNNLAVIYEKDKNLEKAKEYYSKALEYSKKVNFPKGIAMTLSNLAGINISEKKYNEANEKLDESINIYSTINDNYGVTNVNLLKGQIYFETGNYETALIYTEKAYNKAKKIGLLKHESEAALQLSKVYEKMLNFKKSLKYYHEFYKTNDSIFNIENSKITEEMKNRFEVENNKKELTIKNQKITLLENQKKINSVKNIAYISVIILIFIFILFTVIFYKNKIKRKNELIEKNKKINDIEKKALQIEIEAKEFKTKQLEHEIEYKNKELQTFAHYIIDKNDFIIKIQKNIKDIQKNLSVNSHKHLQSILIDINNKIQAVKENEEFLAHVDHINSNFYYKLKNTYPDISENEQRLASLLKIGLSSKEIASILHITSKSVDTNRYRLRKKLNLHQDVNLNIFFRNL
ncbi:MAG: tetratricopeptide repeat protein [Bacteroidales bacterium]|nr:tetratricopeptide repeat protein [Bacteroidales bacterium]